MKSVSMHHLKPARDVERIVSGDQRRLHSSQICRRTSASPNVDIAGRLDEVANIFAEQGASRFRVQAYRRAANVAGREAECEKHYEWAEAHFRQWPFKKHHQ